MAPAQRTSAARSRPKRATVLWVPVGTKLAVSWICAGCSRCLGLTQAELRKARPVVSRPPIAPPTRKP